MSSIPTPTLPDKKNTIPKPNIIMQRKLSFSFEALDRNKFFDIDCTCDGWVSMLLERLKSLSSYTANELRFSRNKSLRFHPVDINQIPKEIYNPSIGDEIYQFSISTNNGRIHGKFVDDVFYIIWLDPLHNMYPRKGTKRKEILKGKTCCDYNFESICEMEEQVREYEELLEG